MFKLKMRLILTEILSFFVSILPLLIVLLVKWNEYVTVGGVKSPEVEVKLGFGFLLICIIVVINVMGKFKMPPRLAVDVVIMAGAWLLEPVMKDLSLIMLMDLIGSFLDIVIFRKVIKNMRERIANEKTADVTTEKMKKVLEEFTGRV